jgi:hypothetical protein
MLEVFKKNKNLGIRPKFTNLMVSIIILVIASSIFLIFSQISIFEKIVVLIMVVFIIINQLVDFYISLWNFVESDQILILGYCDENTGEEMLEKFKISSN